MPSNYPAQLDTFPALTIDDDMNDVASGKDGPTVINNLHAAVAATQARIGVSGSADANSLENRLSTHTGAAGPHTGHALTADLTAHASAAAPHSGHATTGALTAHTGAAAPHSGHALTADLTAHANAAAPHSGHAVSAGIAGGQTIRGGTGAGDSLTVSSTAHATKGAVTVGGALTVREDTARCGIAQVTPTARLHLPAGSAAASTAPLKLTDGPLLIAPEAGAVEQNAGRLFHTDILAVRRALASEHYAMEMAANLMANGFGNLGANRNFSGWTFDAQDTGGFVGVFRINVATGMRLSDDLIPVNTAQRLRQVVWAKSGDAGGANYNPANLQFFGIVCFDADGLVISADHSDKVAGSVETTLASALSPGHTTIALADATGWHNGTTGVSRGIAWFGYANTSGYVYPDYTYTRNSQANIWDAGAISGNLITLRNPWSGPALPAGAAVRNITGAGTFRYNIAVGVSVPNTWTRYEGHMQGVGGAGNTFRFGTAYIKFVHLVNYHGAADNNVRIGGVRFSYDSSANLEDRIGLGAAYKLLAPSSLPANGLAVEGRIGCGLSNPSAQLHVLATTEQLRLAYGAETFSSFTVDSGGRLRIASPVIFRPPSSLSLSNNGDATIVVDSNSTGRIQFRGSDGVTRSFAFTLT